jgi:hypothetical protein
VILPAVQSLRLAGAVGCVFGAREYRASRSRGVLGEGRVGRGWQAHSVRRESCDSPSSPEPAAA